MAALISVNVMFTVVRRAIMLQSLFLELGSHSKSVLFVCVICVWGLREPL
jgi:hypothetical protein